MHHPEFGVFSERVERRKDAQDQARRAVEEAATDDVAIEESQRGAEEQIECRDRLAALEHIARRVARVAIELFEILFHAPIGVVQELAFEAADFARGDDHVGMNAAIAVAALVAEEQPEDVIIVPAAMFDLAAEDEIATPDAVAIAGRTLERGAGFRRPVQE